MAVSNIALNIWLIPIMGIGGAALATLLSVTGYNAVSLWLVWLKFRLQPFGPNTLKALGLAVAAFFFADLIPLSGYDWFDLLLRSGFYGLIFLALVLKFHVSEELNNFFKIKNL
jgi:O-antigen/teichoic acid export membrane protein